MNEHIEIYNPKNVCVYNTILDEEYTYDDVYWVDENHEECIFDYFVYRWNTVLEDNEDWDFMHLYELLDVKKSCGQVVDVKDTANGICYTIEYF